MSVKIVATQSVTVEITASNGMCYAATSATEQSARGELAERLHSLAAQAFKDFQEFQRLANSLNA